MFYHLTFKELIYSIKSDIRMKQNLDFEIQRAELAICHQLSLYVFKC
jgi:hypothetical protein